MIVTLENFNEEYFPLLQEVVTKIESIEIIHFRNGGLVIEVDSYYQLFLFGMAAGHLMAQKDYNEVINKGAESIANFINPSIN